MWEPIVQAMAAFKSSNVEDKMGLITQLGEADECKYCVTFCRVKFCLPCDLETISLTNNCCNF